VNPFFILILFFFIIIPSKVISETVLDAGSFVCGIQADNTLACWGKSGNMPPSGTFFQINTSGRQKCAIRTDNTLICWENNGKEVVSPDKLFSQVSSGDHHACGVLTDNTVVCWGNDEYGQATPPQGDFIQVSVGDEFSCGIRVDNTLACWGRYSEGNKLFPWEHPSGTFSQISAGPYHICSIHTDGRPVCWGARTGVHEQGNPPLKSDGKDTPPEKGIFYQVSGGRAWFSCWLRTDNAVLCSGTPEFPVTEVVRPPHSNCFCRRPSGGCLCESSDKLFTQITAGSDYACGVRFDNTVLCWGENLNGELFPPAGLVLKSADPTACLLYGIHDDDNTTQFFIINSGSSELHPRSQLETHLDIQALDSHPVTNQLYAASGNDTDNPGYLYEMRNGAQDILEIGESGFESIEALAFHPDGTLWGWSQHDGVFQIETHEKVAHLLDLETLSVILPYDRKEIGVDIELTDLTWNTKGTTLYGVGKILTSNTTFKGRLWTYTPEGNKVDSICDQLIEPLAIEAMEMLPNNTLLLSFSENEQLNFWVIDKQSCEIITQEEITTPYYQVKGLAQPDCSHPYYVDPLSNR